MLTGGPVVGRLNAGDANMASITKREADVGLYFGLGGTVTINHNVNFNIAGLAAGVRDIVAALNSISNKEGTIMATLAEIQSAVAEQKSTEDSLLTLVQSIVNENDPAARQSILDGILGNTKGMADAITANTPAAQPPAQPQA